MTSKKADSIPSEQIEFSYELKIPKDRVGVLIGKSGEVKKKLEGETHAKIIIDSKEGDVIIKGDDSIGLYSAREIIRAVGRGFNPDIAQLLLKQDYMFETVDLRDFAPTKNAMLRLKGRVIGSEGRSRKVIEELTETHICIYGKSISIIGEISNVAIAKRAIERLLQGSEHASVYRDLEHKRKEMRLRKVHEDFNLKDTQDI